MSQINECFQIDNIVIVILKLYCKAAVLNLGYAYPMGYVRRSQGVLKI
jgi:hypothetical protein